MHLAQLNVARLQHPLDAPETAEFLAALVPVNALADAAPGFAWRLQTDDGDATSIRALDDDLVIVNQSTWESIEALHAFVYRGDHTAVLRRRRDWFQPWSGPHLVLWWVPDGHRPTLDEGLRRLAQLGAEGPTAAAFDFNHPHGPDGAPLDRHERSGGRIRSDAGDDVPGPSARPADTAPA